MFVDSKESFPKFLAMDLYSQKLLNLSGFAYILTAMNGTLFCISFPLPLGKSMTSHMEFNKNGIHEEFRSVLPEKKKLLRVLGL